METPAPGEDETSPPSSPEKDTAVLPVLDDDFLSSDEPLPAAGVFCQGTEEENTQDGEGGGDTSLTVNLCTTD